MEAIQNTLSTVIASGLPASRRPNAPSYIVSRSVAAVATTPAASPRSTAAESTRSMLAVSDMVASIAGERG